MTNNQLAENSVIQLLNSVKLARDNAERADNRVDHSFYYALTIALEELQERRKADSEPVAYISKSDFDAGYPHILARRDFNKACTMAVYAAQPAPIVEREPIAWLNDAYLARGVVDGEAGSEDAGPGYIPVYRHAQPAPVVPENCVTAEHRRVIEMLLNVCGAAFELADDSCQQDVDGEDCHVVPDDAFQKLSDALDEIENTLPTEDIDRPDVFLAWSAMPRAALKSLLHAQPAPVVPELRVDWQENEFSAGWNACRAAMLQAVPLINEGDIALHNYRTTLEGIGHIRRTLEETFGGLHGTHVEPDVLMECKTICDAIYAAYRGSAPVVPDHVSIFEAAIEECKKCDSIDEHAWNHGVLAVIAEYESCRATMLAAAPQEVGDA